MQLQLTNVLAQLQLYLERANLKHAWAMPLEGTAIFKYSKKQ